LYITPVPLKALRWLGSSREDVRAFPEDARRQAGYELFQIQNGLAPSDWKPMASVGAGVVEIRIDAGTAYRVFYIAKFPEAIYVIHGSKSGRSRRRERTSTLRRNGSAI
jgi:phage-related protein